MIQLILSLTLIVQLNGPTLETPQPESISDCAWAYQIIQAGELGWYWQLEDPAERAQWFDVCEQVAPWFTVERAAFLGADAGGTADLIKAMAVVQCESGLDELANTVRWGGGTDGVWSFMEHLNWQDRLGFPDIDVFDIGQASFLASIMVYGGVNGNVSAPNFWWWWSCARSYKVVRRLGIPVPEASYCPPGSYWADVRPSSGVAARRECVGR